jgi:hypothetical protein
MEKVSVLSSNAQGRLAGERIDMKRRPIRHGGNARADAAGRVPARRAANARAAQRADQAALSSATKS